MGIADWRPPGPEERGGSGPRIAICVMKPYGREHKIECLSKKLQEST